MSESSSISASSTSNGSIPSPSFVKKSKVTKRWKFYLPLWLLVNTLAWLPALFYLKMVPVVYTTRWTIAVNASKSSTTVSLPGIGEASSSSDSPFSSHLADPREVYRTLVETDEVLTDAARQMNMSVKEFGKSRTKILDNTTLMNFEIKGSTPEVTQQKAFALHTALERRLEQLRREEIQQQNHKVEASLIPMEQKLQDAQKRLYAYKARSPLVSVEQLRDLSVNLENLRQKRAEAIVQLRQVGSKARQLSDDLSLSPQQAADALTLRSDRLFQEYLEAYSKVSVELISSSSRFTPSNPAIESKQLEEKMALAALMQQSQKLLGRPMSQEVLQYLTAAGSSSSNVSAERANLFHNVVLLQAEQQGMQSQIQELDQQIAQLEARLYRLSQEESKFDSLQRNTKIAEAVFSSNVTKIDLANANLSRMYPPVSIITRPKLPEKPSEPKTKLALLGSGVGSLLMTAGVLALWWRDRRIQKFREGTLKQPSSINNSNSALHRG
jgi:uncharacterized protein involved in exopolysaccharide biosynthesis